MRRRQWLWCALLLVGCQKASAPLPDLFPQTVAGVWHRTKLATPSVSDSPDPVPRTEINRFETADYEGPGKLQARVYEMDNASVADEMQKRWRPSADTVFFYRDKYFVVVKWEDADRKALEAFVADLEKRLPK